MNRKIKTFIYFLTFALLVVSLQDFCQKKTQGFTLSKAKSRSKEKKTLDLSIEDQESIEAILKQPFYFMKKGLQCYAFVSKDGNYVLKLLRWKELESPFWKKSEACKELKKKHDFESYQMAFEELKEDTGLIYLHLSKTQGFNVFLELYDAIKVQHLIKADDIEFILQKKADPFLSYFEKNKTDERKMRSFLRELALVLHDRVNKLITDSDVSLEYNMGVLQDHPVLFDIGNLTKITEISPLTELLEKEMRLVLKWLHQNSPSLALFLEREIQDLSQESL